MNGIKPTKHIIAYIDFLGTQEKIKNDVDHKHLMFLKSLYDYIEQQVAKKNKSNQANHFLKEIKIRSFSDNILFAVSTNTTDMLVTCALDEVIMICAEIQLRALKEGILTRGGITVGEIFVNKNFAYGKGLLDVLTMEEEIAHFPRIILNNSLEDKYQKYFSKNTRTVLDSDNIRYINFYETKKLEESDIRLCERQLEKLKKANNQDLKILSKVNWVIKHHNIYTAQFNIKHIQESNITKKSFEPLSQIQLDLGLNNTKGAN